MWKKKTVKKAPRDTQINQNKPKEQTQGPVLMCGRMMIFAYSYSSSLLTAGAFRETHKTTL